MFLKYITIICKNLIISCDLFWHINSFKINASSSIVFTKFSLGYDTIEIITPHEHYINSTVPKYFKNINDIKNLSFQNWKNLIEINESFFILQSNIFIPFPENLTKINKHSFRNCGNLTNVILNESINQIQQGAFESCSKLEYFEIRSRKESFIGVNAFIYCRSLKIFKYNSIKIAFDMPFISFSDTSYRSLSIVTPNNPSNIILPFFFFRNTQKSITLEENIKELGVGAFACSSLETIVLNNKIEIIPPYCFYNCINLTNISNFCCSTISEYSFCDCKKLNTISSYAFESSSLNLSIIDAEYIWDYTFSNTKIRYVTFTDNVLFVGFKAFYNTVIYQLNLGQSLIKFPSYIFSNSNITEYSIPNNIKYIEEGCFCGCKNLTTIRNLINVDYIGDRAFEGCTSLTLSNGLYYIGFDAFSNCNLVTSMKISNHIQTIKTGTFFNCTSLSYFLFPESLISIEDEAFYNCISLEITRLPPSVSFIGTMAFGNCKIFQYHSICNSNVKFEFDAFSNSFIEIINISSEYIFINSYAISNCPFLHTVIIDANNGIIEHSAFYNCPNLTFIDFKSSKLTLCSYCFFNLNISSFTFPSGCISEPSVFKNCTKLKTITFQSNQRFSHYLDSILHIPGLEKIYFDDNTWSSYLSDDDCETLKGVELYYTGQEKTDENFDDLFAYSIYKNRLKVHVPYTYILDTFCDVEVIRERETNGRLMLENMVFCYQNSRINEPTVLHVSRTLSIFSQNLINALRS